MKWEWGGGEKEGREVMGRGVSLVYATLNVRNLSLGLSGMVIGSSVVRDGTAGAAGGPLDGG